MPVRILPMVKIDRLIKAACPLPFTDTQNLDVYQMESAVLFAVNPQQIAAPPWATIH